MVCLDLMLLSGYCISLANSLSVVMISGDTGISEAGKTLSDHLIMAVLALLRKEVAEHGRQIPQYFHLFFMYANLGPEVVGTLNYLPSTLQLMSHLMTVLLLYRGSSSYL